MSSSKTSFSSSILLPLLLIALCILALPLPSAHGAPPLAATPTTTSAPAASPTGGIVGPPGQTQPPPGQPPLAVNLTVTTVCASSDDGAWIVGLNGLTVTLAKVQQGSTTPPMTFAPTNINKADKNAKTGKCFEGPANTVYYISDSLSGYFLINGAAATWTYLQPQPQTKNTFSVDLLNASTSAVGFAQTGSTDSVAVGVFSGVISRWNLVSSVASTVVSLTGIAKMNGDTSIIGLALSSPAYLWVYYTATDTSQQLARINLDNLTDHTSTQVMVGLTTLVQLKANDGVALLGPASSPVGNTVVQYFWNNKPSTSKTITTETNALTQDQFIVSDTSVLQVNPSRLVVSAIAVPNGEQTATATSLPHPSDPATPTHKSASPLGVILGVVGGVVALMAIAATLILWRRRSKKAKNLFPPKRDDTLIPLGLYHQDRSLPEIPRHLDNDLERLGYAGSRNQDGYGNTYSNQHNSQHRPNASNSSYLVDDPRNSSQYNLDSTMPIEAAMRHHQHDTHTAQGLTHSISVSSTTSNFARRNAKNGKRFEEKIQLQVIRYETQDAHLISPHGPTGRLVLGTYHVVSPPRSARSIKKQGGTSPGVARSGTVVVRRSRLDMNTSGSAEAAAAAGESSMLLTECENQHTFEVATLKWYMTEIHWKREAALLKHLKSPIFVMELLESYCIPSLQNRVHTYPFVNSMGACSSLLSDLGPVQTAAHARSILRSISAAVEWCHRHGVVHLNIQPGSFFLEDGIDPMTEGASWKLWDFTCARFIGEPVGLVGGGGGHEMGHPSHPGSGASSGAASPSHLGVGQGSFAFMEQRQHEEKMDRIGGNPLPPAYTAPELLEAWRAGDTTYPAEACMDAWSLGCVYYEILTGGQPLFQTEAEAWELVGGWSNQGGWTSQDFRVPYPPSPPVPAQYSLGGQGSTPEMSAAFQRSQILDPSGSIARLLQDMMTVHADERVSLETIMERIY